MAPAKKEPVRKIGLVGMHPTGYSRAILEGFLACSDTKPHWQLMHEPYATVESVRKMVEVFQPDALICESRDPKVLNYLSQWRGAVVFVAVQLPPEYLDSFPVIRADNPEIGRLGFTHLRERGFNRFLFAGWDEAGLSNDRRCGYVQAARESGFEVAEVHVVQEGSDVQVLSDALGGDPRPAALFAVNDEVGLNMVRAAKEASISVPEQLAVLGVDNHPILCRISHPLLSSIDPGTTRIGYRAAERIQEVFQGKPMMPGEERIAPVRVVSRSSTDIVSTSDEKLSEVFRTISEQGCDDLEISSLAKRSGMSRRSLETRYKSTFGFTMGEHIIRVKVKRACELLEYTDFYTPDIAAECNWPSASHMGVMFKRHMKMTPTEYRRHIRT